MRRACGATERLSVSEDSLGASDISSLLKEVARELGPKGPQHVILVVGGSLLALHYLRDSTRDVDSAKRLATEVKSAVSVVAERHGLAPLWMNDHAAPYRPLTLREKECDILLAEGRLRALGAPLRIVFIMKLYASRRRDAEDLKRLWTLCQFESAEEAVEFFYESYPHEERNPYLADHIRTVT